MERAQRWKNLGLANDTVFFITTVQGFVKVFADPRIADISTKRILTDCKQYGARLYAFVIMPEHIHLLLRLPPQMTVTSFADALKSKVALSVLHELSTGAKRTLQGNAH